MGELSRRIIQETDGNSKFREPHWLPYTDICDFCANKQDLKKFETELDIRHNKLEVTC